MKIKGEKIHFLYPCHQERCLERYFHETGRTITNI